MKPKHALAVLALALTTTQPVRAADLLVSQYKNDPSGAPYAVALAKGFFKKHGVDIAGIISGAGGGGSVRSAMASDLGYGDVAAGPVIVAAQKGEDIKIIGFNSNTLAAVAVITRVDSPIKTAADMKGKKFGISNPRSLGEMMGVMAMQKAGLKRGDVQMVPLGSLGGALTALDKGAVDVTVMPIILFYQRGGESKYRVLVRSTELPSVPAQLVVATGKAIKDHPDQLRGILAARREGTKFIYDHTDEAIQILSKIYAPLPPKEVGQLVKQMVAAKFWSEGRIEMPLLENAANAMRAVGALKGDADLKKMVDSSLLPADLRK